MSLEGVDENGGWRRKLGWWRQASGQKRRNDTVKFVGRVKGRGEEGWPREEGRRRGLGEFPR